MSPPTARKPPERPDTATLMEAYKEVCRSYERIDDFRAKLLGFLPVVNGAGLFLILGNESPGDSKWSFFLVSGVFGAIITLGLLCFEARGFQRCLRLVTVGQALERSMKIKGWFTRWPHSVRRIINEPFASGLIYSAVFAAWIYVALMSASTAAAIAVATIAFLVVCIASRGYYWWVTRIEEVERRGARTSNRWTRWFDRLDPERSAA